MQKKNGSGISYLTKMSNVKLIGKFKSVSCSELPSLFWIFHGFFSSILFFILATTNRWRGVIYTFRSAMWGGKHAHLAKVGNFYHNGIIINWEGLLPWLPINPHECMLSCTLTELKTDSFCLHADITMKLKTRGGGGGGILTGIWFVFKLKSRTKQEYSIWYHFDKA